jgi:hypothetical protein
VLTREFGTVEYELNLTEPEPLPQAS